MTNELTDQQIGRQIGSPADRSVAARRVSLRRVDAVAPPPCVPLEPGTQLATHILADIAVGLGRAEALWRPHVDHDPLSRTSVRLVATEVYEAWLLGWTPTQQVDLHDHGGANAAFVVLEGELTEVTVGTPGTTTDRLGAGDVSTVPSGVIHDVLNTGRADATSLHVYSHPLQKMTFFDPDGTPRHTELVEHVPALLTTADQSRGLHPSRSG